MSKPDEIHRLKAERMEKADRIREAGLNPYSNDFKPELTVTEFKQRYGDKSTEALEKVNTVATLAGRVMAMRKMGKATFMRIRDRTGDIQLLLKKDVVGEGAYTHLKSTDMGDLIGVAGNPMRTKTEELTLQVEGFRVLTKSVQPLPDKFHGLQDVEQRYRMRYVDLIMNPEVRRIFHTRGRIVRGIRAFLDARDYLEVETPVLQAEYGGAAAKPFLTHHNALDVDLHMRIATELHLKRLVVGGLERVYEIGRIFRNEGVSTRHNPEFTSIEFYEAYATYEDLMDLTEEMITTLVTDIHGSDQLSYAGKTMNVGRPWRRVSIPTLVGEHLDVGALDDIASVREALDHVVGHCVSAEAPLLTCLAELSDDEADQLIPGIEKGDGPITERAKAALKGAGADFWANLGDAIDAHLPSDSAPPPTVKSDEVTDPGVATDEWEEKTGEVSAKGPPYDENYERRRRLALALLYQVYDHEIEGDIYDPTFVTGFSVSVSPLARRRESDPALVDRFELIMGGMELANAFSELNDPVDQKARFEAQERERTRGDAEAHGIDEDFVRALEYGMPPTAGEGIGIDRLVMLLTDQPSIREVILFPQLRPEG
jgi:lysyl-tRNA synthetase class 2